MLQSMRSAAKYIWIILIIAFVVGFLLIETSGLLGRAPVTAGTTVAEVNGEEILYTTWSTASQQRAQQVEQQQGRSLTLDDRRRIEDEVFDELVQAVLLAQEYEKRGIRVTDQEIIDAALYNPPQPIMQSAELQTDGRFDPEKYQRYLRSPAARQSGLYPQLEQYYRSEIPRAKLYDQVTSEIYVTDTRLWQSYKDQHDSAQVTVVPMDIASIQDNAVTVTDADLHAHYNAHKDNYDRPGRAILSILRVPRTITAADSAAAQSRILALREEILKGAKFQDVARRESADSASVEQGGSLGRGVRGRFLKEFEDAAFALKTGELSQPVLTQFGYHLIRADDRAGDSLGVSHILLRIQQSDSSATRTDRLADQLSKLAASQDQPATFDSAGRTLGLTALQAVALEGEPLTLEGKYVPSVSAWAFGGAQPGQSSELFDSEDAYYLARLDTLTEAGVQSFDVVKEDVRRAVLEEKKLAHVMPSAEALARSAAASTLEEAAEAKGLKATQTPMFARTGFAPGLGRVNEAIGAAFSLPIGKVSAPIKTRTGVFVMRVDKRVEADRGAWEAQKAAQRPQMLSALRQQRLRAYLEDLRKTADIEDKRKEINAQLTRQAS